MPRGGKRPGAGATKGNINALKHGLRSRAYLDTGLPKRKYKRHPGKGWHGPHPCVPHPYARGNDYAIKHGRYSKKVTELMKTPQFQNMGLKEDELRDFIVGQIKQTRI